MNSAGVRGVRLFRHIMKAHRRHLPPQLQALGNSYVRAEFRLHKKVEKEEILSKFFGEWEVYLRTIKAPEGRFGQNLDHSNVATMSEAQKKKLEELKEAAKNAAAEVPVSHP